MSKGIKRIILDNQVQNVTELNNEGKILFEFLTLVVDIKYRHKYGKKIANSEATDYSDGTKAGES